MNLIEVDTSISRTIASGVRRIRVKMKDRILIVYASWAGSTGEVAEAIAAEMRAGHINAEALPVRKVTSLDGYQAVVIGSAIHAGQVHPDVIRFVQKHEEKLSLLPVAFYVVCLTMKEDTEENRCTVNSYLLLLHEKAPKVLPVDVGLFAGALVYQKLPLLMQWMLKSMKLEEGDFRDWDAIRAWARKVLPLLLERNEPDRNVPA